MRLIGIERAAEILGLSRRHADRLLAQRGVKRIEFSVRNGSSLRRLMFESKDIEALAEIYVKDTARYKSKTVVL